MEFRGGHRVPRVYSPPTRKVECVRSFLLGGCQHECVLPARANGARAERTSVDTPPAGMTERTRLSSRGEYTQGTSCPDPELQWLRIAVTITSVVSAVTPEVWIRGFFHVVISARAYCMLLTFLARLHEVGCMNTKTAFCIIRRKRT